MNKPWRVFLHADSYRHGYKLPGVYECRVTIIWASRLQVKLHEVYLKLLARSGFVWFYVTVKKAGAISKNRDKQMTYIVRVRFRGNFITVSVPVSCLGITFIIIGWG